MDELKSGYLESAVFQQILKLNKITLRDTDFQVLKEKTEKIEDGKNQMNYKDALKWMTVDLSLMDPFISPWIIRTHESFMGSQRGSLASRASILSGLSSLSDVSGITALKN